MPRMGDAALDSQLWLVDAVLTDLAVRTGKFSWSACAGWRRGDVRHPDRRGRSVSPGAPRSCASDRSIEAMVTQAQAHLTQTLGAPVPLCPRHDHPLVGASVDSRLWWRCPEGQWECALGEYEEQTWPQLDVPSLAPILSTIAAPERSLSRGTDIGVTRSGGQLVANFGLVGVNDELLGVLADVAAPLPGDHARVSECDDSRQSAAGRHDLKSLPLNHARDQRKRRQAGAGPACGSCMKSGGAAGECRE